MYVWYVWYVWYGMVSMHKSIKGEFTRSWMTDRAPYHIVCLVYVVYVTTGSIGGNGGIRLLQNSAEYGFRVALVVFGVLGS